MIAPYRDIADLLAVSEGWAHKMLRQLRELKALVVVEPHAGRRGIKYAINPNLFAWRDIPWKTDVELVWFRAFHDELAGVEADHVRSAALQQRGTTSVAPRSKSAALRRTDRVVPRSESAAVRAACAALLDRGPDADGSQKGVLSVVPDDPVVSAEQARRDRKEWSSDERAAMKAVYRQAARSDRGKWWSQSQREAVCDIVAVHGWNDHTHQTLTELGTGHWLPTLIEHWSEALELGGAVDSTTAAEQVVAPAEYVPDEVEPAGPEVAAAMLAAARRRGRSDVTPPCDTELVAAGGSA